MYHTGSWHSFETRTYRASTERGKLIHAESGRREHAVLLLHGLMGNPMEMQYLAKRFRQAGFATHTPHLSGYGFAPSQTPFAAQTWQQWHTQVLEHFDELKRTYRTVSVCGLCIGAVLALNLAAERKSEVSALSLLATTLAFDGWSIPWYGFLAPLVYYTPLRYVYAYGEREPYGLKNKALRKWIAREMAEKTTSIAGASSLHMTAVFQAHKLIKHVRRALPTVGVPALVMHASEDDVASLKSAEFVVDNIGSSDVHLTILHDSYHMITLDNEKQLVGDETLRFFSERAGGVAPPERAVQPAAVREVRAARSGA
jgi:carboxylesterase